LASGVDCISGVISPGVSQTEEEEENKRAAAPPSSPSSIVCVFGVVVDGLFFILFGYIMFTLLLLFLPSVFFSSCPGAIGRDYLARSQTAVNDWKKKKKKKKKKHPNSSRVRPACELARPCLHNNLLLFFRNFASFFWLMTHNSIRLEHT
jgi:hypothetical protein